jgi:hypothetical protein
MISRRIFLISNKYLKKLKLVVKMDQVIQIIALELTVERQTKRSRE